MSSSVLSDPGDELGGAGPRPLFFRPNLIPARTAEETTYWSYFSYDIFCSSLSR